MPRRWRILCNERGFTPTHLLLTHGHGDHMGGAADLKDLFPQIQIVLGEKDLEMIGDGEKSMSNAVAPYARPFVPDILVKEGDKIVSGSMTFTVMETPGHTRGGVTYIKNNELYCGDTLFQGSMGRTEPVRGRRRAEMYRVARAPRLVCRAATRFFRATAARPTWTTEELGQPLPAPGNRNGINCQSPKKFTAFRRTIFA